MTWNDVYTLLPRLRENDPVAWAEMSYMVYPVLAEAAARVVGTGWADASSSDVAQEAWMKIRAGFASFRGADTPADTAACLRAWVRTVVKNVSIRECRRHAGPTTIDPVTGGRPDPATSDPSPSAQAVQTEWKSRLEAAIAKLGPDEQLIVRRSLYEGASSRQIASELGLPDHTVVGGWRREILETLKQTLGSES